MLWINAVTVHCSKDSPDFPGFPAAVVVVVDVLEDARNKWIQEVWWCDAVEHYQS